MLLEVALELYGEGSPWLQRVQLEKNMKLDFTALPFGTAFETFFEGAQESRIVLLCLCRGHLQSGILYRILGNFGCVLFDIGCG